MMEQERDISPIKFFDFWNVSLMWFLPRLDKPMVPWSRSNLCLLPECFINFIISVIIFEKVEKGVRADCLLIFRRICRQQTF